MNKEVRDRLEQFILAVIDNYESCTYEITNLAVSAALKLVEIDAQTTNTASLSQAIKSVI